MKSYIQGLVTGGVLIFAFMVLTGQKHGHKNNHVHHDIDDIMHKLEDLEGRIKNIEVECIVIMLSDTDFCKILQGYSLSK